MSFEDDFNKNFPSLINKGVDSFESDDGNDCSVEMNENWYDEHHIFKHCLDKQRVREAIEKHRYENLAFVNEILKELGLDKE